MSESTQVAGAGYLSAGTVLAGRYAVGREIGRGGYSVVYAARDRKLDADVAVKLLVPPPALARIARERMRREVQAVRGLSHANVVGVHDFLDEGPWSFIVMELVDGPDLSVYVQEHGALDAAAATRLGREVSAALAAAHRNGILHRDIKPQNILIDEDGRARLTDFGSAKLEGQVTVTQTGGIVGTLGYMAPEIIAGSRGDARSDLYALGLTMYFALTARLPDRASPHLPPTSSEAGFNPGDEREDIPSWLAAIVARATTATPGHRFPTAGSLGEALARGAKSGTGTSGESRDAIGRCIVCGEPEPLGLAVCPRCGGTAPGVADTLIFIERPASMSDRAALARRLYALLEGRAPSSDVAAVAAGHRALVRVPAASSDRVIAQLARHQVFARALPPLQATALLPLKFYGMLAAVVGVGTLAGVLAVPSLLWTSPLVAGMLWFGAQLRLQNAAVATADRTTALPADLERQAVEAFEELPPGHARSLLADLIRLAQGLHANAGHQDRPDLVSHLTVLLSHSCGAARDLARLDDYLHRTAEQRASLPDAPPEWFDGVARAERTRDALVQQLLEVTHLVGRATTAAAESSRALGEDLVEVAREIEMHFTAHARAAREVEELLSGSPPE